MFRKKVFWIVLIVLALLGGGGYVAYAKGLLPWFGTQKAAAETATLETAEVTTGDLSITADGSGVLMPSVEYELSFATSGTLAELLVKVGDKVKAGDVLAWIDDTELRNQVASAELAVVQAGKALEEAADTAVLEQAVAQAELKVTQAEADLAVAEADLDELVNWAPDETEVDVAKTNLTIAQISYQNTVAKNNMLDQDKASAQIKLEEAVENLQAAQENYVNAMDAARDWEKNIESTRENAAKALKNAQDDLEFAQADYDLAQIDESVIDVENARLKVLSAQETLDELQTPPDEETITAARIKVQELQVTLAQAKLDLADAQEALADVDTAEAELTLQQAKLDLESAQKNLEGATLTAPIDGTVTAVNASTGDEVNGAVITVSNLNEPLIEFWVEESDLNSVAVGNRITVIFEALPELTFNGEIISVEPVLVSVGNTTAVQAWASLDISSNPVNLLGEMNAEVEIVAGEALNAVLVPVEALREISEGQYAVFVVLDSGELEMRTVEIGLKDYVNAVVISGLEAGETVSLGDSSSTTTTTTTNDDNDNGMPQMDGGGFPGGGGMPPMGPGG